ncbi:UvrD-helicase domain-containing protein [Paraburkholderia aspalathi]|uniref:UvrD-helicase domain-containing protein n=1 Tax=Paraburkholderia aspalathi TaxID=1324617 RepID=UPI0038BC6FCF
MTKLLSWLHRFLVSIFEFIAQWFRQDSETKSLKPATLSVPVVKKTLRLYEGRPLEFEDSKKDAARRFLHRRDPTTGKVRGPSEAQEQLIFARERGVSVLAGAGSGKSTSLVSRLLFMRHQLDIRYSQISVFTFTRKSRADFIKKLIEESSHWPRPIGEKLAQRLVRTFHSKALAMARGAMDPNTRIFEFLGAPVKASSANSSLTLADIEAELDGDPVLAELSENESEANQLLNLFSSDLTTEQAEFLDGVYRRSFASSEPFRAAIRKILEASIQPIAPRRPGDAEVQKAKENVDSLVRLDKLLIELVTDDWRKRQLWPIAGVNEVDSNGQSFELSAYGALFLANGYVPRLNAYVVLGVHKDIRSTALRAKPTHKGWAAASVEWNKVQVLLGFCDKPILYIRHAWQLQNLAKLLSFEAGVASAEVPKFQTVPPGDYKAAVIDMALYQCGTFAENLALDPRKIQNAKGLVPGSVERHFASAVAIFFEELYRTFETEGVVSFNRLFARLSTQGDWLDKVNGGSLLTMKYLLIDEFQDISPAIVKLVVAMHERLRAISLDSDAPSVMCVGDDWQSIYGWRGSSPQFFLNFPRYFEGARNQTYRLRDNYRSSANVVTAAEAALSDLTEQFPGKQGGIAKGEWRDLKYPVALVPEFNAKDAVALVRTILDRLPANERLYVLTRGSENPVFVEISRAFKSESSERFLATTFHQSKGLEAEYVILIGDTQYDSTNDFRNALYQMAALGSAQSATPYDDAQRDEARRLAYVGITRAMKLCVWLCQPRDGGTFVRLPENGPNSQHMSIAEVHTLLNMALSVERVA